MSDCELVKPKQGKYILIYDGYCYHLNTRRNSKFYWRCSRKDSAQCDVFVTTQFTADNTHVVMSQNHKHAHLPDPEKLLEYRLKENLKEKANSSMDTPAQIIQRCIQVVPSTLLLICPIRIR